MRPEDNITPLIQENALEHLRNGGNLIDFAENCGVNFWALTNELQNTPEKRNTFNEAMTARAEFSKAKILREIERLAHSDIREIYNKDGSLKPVSEWSESAAASIVGIDTQEFDDGGGIIKKVKRESKIAALKMLAVQVDQLKPRPIEVTGQLTYEQILANSWKDGELDHDKGES